MYIAFVDNAFAERERGSSKSYWDLVSQFRSSALSSNGPTGVQSLSLWLFALSHHVSKLDSASHSQLVDNILDLPWAGAGDDFSRSWCRFVCALVSARLEWASSVLDRIVKAFRWKSNWLPLQPFNATAPTADSSTASTSAVQASTSAQQQQPTRRLLYTRCHLLLRALLTLIPTLPSSLNPLLIKHFPHKRDGKREQSTYARNILFVTQYEPQVAETVWRVVVDRAIGLDVEIQIELDDDDDDQEECEDEGSMADPFDLVIDDDEDSDDEDDDEEDGGGIDDISDDEAVGSSDDERRNGTAAETEAQAEQRERKVRDMVGKLDGLLKVCFDHIDFIGKGKGKQNNDLVLDSRPTWLSEFLGTGGSRVGSASTPTLERSHSSSTLRGTRSKDEDDAKSDDSSDDPSLPPPSGITKRYSPTTAQGSDGDDEAMQASKDTLFRQLLGLFSRSILPTFKCRHVQFMLFWYCSLDTDFADYFLGFLIHKAIYAGSAIEDGFGSTSVDQRGDSDNATRGEPIVLRQAAASYVASFVSRAKYISPPYTRTVVFNLCSYLEAHLEAYSNAVAFVNSIGGLNGVDEKTQRLALAPPGSEEHAIFYAVAQAVFYIFCFRWQDLQNPSTSQSGAMLDATRVLNGLQGDSKGRDAAGVEFEDHEHDAGFMIGSLSSTGSSSYALPTSLRNRGAVEDEEEDGVAASVGQSSKPAINVKFPEDEEGKSSGPSTADWSPGLSVLQRAILSGLNPLQYCSPTVVRQFATVAQHVGFLYCWSVIESNRRGGGGAGAGPQEPSAGVIGQKAAHSSNGPSKGVSGHGAALTKDLEGFFPFDPYRLNSTSDSFIKPLYREWHEVAPAGMMADSDDEDSDADSSSSSDDDEDEDDVSISDLDDQHLSTPGLEIPGAGKGSRHHRARNGGGKKSDASAWLSPSDASSSTHGTSDSIHGRDDAAFAKSLEAMSMSAS